MTLQFDIFLQENNISTDQLPEEIQKSISKVRALYTSIKKLPEGEEKELLKKEVEELDIDIQELIEKHFDIELTNNDIIGMQYPPTKTPKKQQNNSSNYPNEQVLDRLKAMGYTKGIDRSSLHQMGIQSELTRTTQIGKHILKRVSLTRYTFDLI